MSCWNCEYNYYGAVFGTPFGSARIVVPFREPCDTHAARTFSTVNINAFGGWAPCADEGAAPSKRNKRNNFL